MRQAVVSEWKRRERIMTITLEGESSIMELLREDVRRQILAIEKAHQAEGEPRDEEFFAMLCDPKAYAAFFHDRIWLALNPEDRTLYFEKYYRANDTERPFVASGLLDRLDKIVTEADETLKSHEGRSSFIH